MPRMRCSPLLCLMLVTAVHAQTNVYKCVDGPHPVYQQTPMPGACGMALGGARGAVAVTRTGAKAGRRGQRGAGATAHRALGAAAGRADTHQHGPQGL